MFEFKLVDKLKVWVKTNIEEEMWKQLNRDDKDLIVADKNEMH